MLSPPLSPYDFAHTTTDTPTTLPNVSRQRSTSSETPLCRDPKRRRQNDDGPRALELLDDWRALGDLQPQQPLLQPLLDDLRGSFGWGPQEQPPTAALDYFLRAPPPSAHLPTPSSISHSSFPSGARPTLSRSATAPVDSDFSASEPSAAGFCGGDRLTDVQREATVSGYVDLPAPPYARDGGLPHRRETDPGRSGGESSQKDKFVSGLVGASVIAIESIWGVSPPSAAESAPASASPDGSVLPLQWFVREVLRRSRTSCSTLQVSLYYLHKCRREIRDSVARSETGQLLEEHASRSPSPSDMDCYPSPPHTPIDTISDRDRFATLADSQPSPILCGRRMFLAALICASKFLQDRNYSNRAWAKISGLPVQEINENERVFLGLMKFQLHLGAEDFHKWTERLASLATQGAALESTASSSSAATTLPGRGLSRSATEYPPAPPLQEINVATTLSAAAAARKPLGRARSVPDASEHGPTAFAPRPDVLLRLPTAPKRPTGQQQYATPTMSPSFASPTAPVELQQQHHQFSSAGPASVAVAPRRVHSLRTSRSNLGLVGGLPGQQFAMDSANYAGFGISAH